MTQQTQDAVLRMTRRFDAPRDRVFEAWTSPHVLREWWRAGPNWSTPEAEVDLREGGSYRLAMRDPESGQTHTIVGEYRVVQPPERLVYTWTWETTPEEMRGSAGSLVTVLFTDEGGATNVVITHSGFADEQIRDLHEHGWNACLANLEQILG
jgi:uncharacterized protein YndB with AHSA1/START domain